MSCFKERLKELRQLNKLSQQDLGNKLNIKKTTISNYETGYSTPSDENTYISIADFFGVSVDYLLGRTNDSNATISAHHSFDMDNIEFKEWADVKEQLRKKLVKAGKIKEGEPLPPSYLKRFIQLALQLQDFTSDLE